MGFGRAGVLGTPLMYYTRDVLRLENIILMHTVTLAATSTHQLKSELEYSHRKSNMSWTLKLARVCSGNCCPSPKFKAEGLLESVSHGLHGKQQRDFFKTVSF